MGTRQITAKFDRGNITSDASGLLLREVDQRAGIIERFARRLNDYGNADKVEHTVVELPGQSLLPVSLAREIGEIRPSEFGEPVEKAEKGQA